MPAAAPHSPILALGSNEFSPEFGIVLFDPRKRVGSPLLADGSIRRYAAWSPDGRWLSYMESSGGFFDSTRLSIAAADGTGRRDLAVLHEVRRSIWSPDGSEVIFQATGKLSRVRVW